MNESSSADKTAEQRLHKVYGLTVERFKELWAACSGLCQICDREMHSRFIDSQKGDRSSRCNIDHCHESGEVRGLLCTACNTALGKMNDDTARLQKAINYLSKPSTGIKNDTGETDKQRQLREMENAMRLLGFRKDSHGRYVSAQYRPRNMKKRDFA